MFRGRVNCFWGKLEGEFVKGNFAEKDLALTLEKQPAAEWRKQKHPLLLGLLASQCPAFGPNNTKLQNWKTKNIFRENVISPVLSVQVHEAQCTK